MLKLAMNVGSFALAEHYLCALLANAVIYGKRDVILKVNEVREFYHVPLIPLPEDKDEEDEAWHHTGLNCTADDQAYSSAQYNARLHLPLLCLQAEGSVAHDKTHAPRSPSKSHHACHR